jgi:hypothetical protein
MRTPRDPNLALALDPALNQPTVRPSKGAFTIKAVLVFFAALALVYLGVFYGIEYMNYRKGPWELDFSTNGTGTPIVIIHQPHFEISGFLLIFRGDSVLRTNLPQRVALERPRTTVPFGKIIYADVRTLPGIVTFDFFGHEIELAPRLLVVNRQRLKWNQQNRIELWPTNKPAIPPRPPKGWE